MFAAGSSCDAVSCYGGAIAGWTQGNLKYLQLTEHYV